LKFDEIGYWSEIKLDIVRSYAAEYSKILAAQTRPKLFHVYVDAFAGAGMHLSERTGEMVPGSPLNVLQVVPPFREYHLIDLDEARVEHLRKITTGREMVFVHAGDCNEVLLKKVFPRVRFDQYRRALCLLDPYGLTLRWEVIEAAGKMKSVDLFLNFPVMDMNRNVLWLKPEGVDPANVERMNAYWGDDSWRKIAYAEQPTLFGEADLVKHGGNQAIVDAFRQRLRRVAGFKNVIEPMPMTNSKEAVVYYLFFASQKDVANRIVKHIFKKYGARVA
jgi:three-Cys-motif partner protein